MSIVASLKDKGLVVISGWAYAGFINTTNYARLLIGINKIFAVVDGFHLTGRGIYDKAIELGEKYLQPTTCTILTFDSAM